MDIRIAFAVFALSLSALIAITAYDLNGGGSYEGKPQLFAQ